MATTPATAEIDLFADDILIDPYPAFAALRDLGAVVHLPANDVYALTRYDAIRDALGDPETFSSVKAIGFNPGVNEALQGTSLASDPPMHTQLRATLSANLTPHCAASASRSPRRRMPSSPGSQRAAGSRRSTSSRAHSRSRSWPTSSASPAR